jgi:hypothetical protein
MLSLLLVTQVRLILEMADSKSDQSLLELRLTGWPGKPGPCRFFIFDSRSGNWHPANLIDQSPNMLFELIQIIIDDADLTAVQKLIEKGASILHTRLIG